MPFPVRRSAARLCPSHAGEKETSCWLGVLRDAPRYFKQPTVFTGGSLDMLGGGNSNIFLVSPKMGGEMIQFDEFVFFKLVETAN